MLGRLSVKDEIKAILENDKWTLEALATIDPSILEAYPRIGPVISKRIVKEAKVLATPRNAYIPTPQITLGKSVRIRRIEESQK